MSGGTETILVAEDDPLVRALTEGLLTRAGYRVLMAANGEEALEVARRNADEIDLLILDVMMPGLGGRAAYDAIRSILPEVPALFTSGYSEAAIHKDFVLEPGLALLRKPFRRDELLEAVRRQLERRTHP